jgi:transposase
MTHRGAVNGRTFLGFVKTRLGPWLRAGDIVVMDNLNMHKMNAVRQAIVDVGATVIYLPTYSPELNPIERLWADRKRDLRTLAVNLVSELAAAIRRLRTRVPIEKTAGWFRHSHRTRHSIEINKRLGRSSRIATAKLERERGRYGALP